MSESDRMPMSYDEASTYYDAIYEAMKDYAAEAERLRHLLEHYAQRPVRDLLDMACGTGLHDQYLKDHYCVEGADLSLSQLAIARRRCPDLVFHQADMTNFELARDYDAVICLFAAIGHVITEEKLHAAVRAMAAHVRPGGLVAIEPFIDPSEFRPGHISVDQDADRDPRVVRVSYSERAGNVLKLTMHHYISAAGMVSVAKTLCFDIAMFSADQLRAAMDSAGLEVFHDPEGLMGRGLYLGRVPECALAQRRRATPATAVRLPEYRADTGAGLGRGRPL
jgi:SAM-dependent methyltransferase